MYYIYHIPGVKIGCTNNVEHRMAEQGFSEWEILEQHEDGWLAGDREQELQKQYGYRVDNVHYMIALQNREIGAAKGRAKIQATRTKEERSRIAKLGFEAGGKARAIAGGKATKGIPKAKYQCPHCGKKGGRPAMKRWHGENCRHKQ